MIWTRFEVMGVLAVPLGLMLVQTDLPLTLVAQGETQFSYTEADVSFSEDVAPILEGKCVILLRGHCSFVEKARRAQAAGAKGLIVVNSSDREVLRMTSSTST